ncbi:hypothetical protein ACOSP7_027439 [Xanthoceras sorbifolium]|uniref:Uncharacterized protein n=1 Tax=Xanthoceras sorbifolium TaxID=99658 RepID=A0ABQ8HG49_9ROSI|nr:hypothetical protein JRO89_XS11G0188800 [Xanthoceras sorbifolium]
MDTTATATKTFLNSNRAGGQPWTDEKHLHYLNSMEASFVRTMFENNGRLLPLDRLLPDTSDSTLDLKKHGTNNKHALNPSAADIIGSRRRSNIDSKADKRARRKSYHQSYTSSQDQVVPQMENRRGDKDENGSAKCTRGSGPAIGL